MTLSRQNIQVSLEAHQPSVDALQKDMMSVKQIVARSRPGLARTHPDVQRFEKEVDGLTSRWEALCIQVNDRSVSGQFSLDTWLKKIANDSPNINKHIALKIYANVSFVMVY